MLEAFFSWLRSVHDRYARVILASIATLMLPLMVLTTVATLDNWRQDGERDKLLQCFDEYAAASSETSVAVREASAAKDIATTEAWRALNAEGETFLRLTKRILNRTADEADFTALSESLERRAEAGRDLEDAQDALDKARADNPIPPAPSEFCADAD